MSQIAWLSIVIEEDKLCIMDNLWLDKCPNLKCQIALEGILETWLFEETESQDCKDTLFDGETTEEIEWPWGGAGAEGWNL